MMEVDYRKIVFTSVQVLERNLPILYVVHDEEDDWQFLSGSESGDDAEGRIISLGTAISLDDSLRSILWLPEGSEAYRKDIRSPWEISIRKPDDSNG